MIQLSNDLKQLAPTASVLPRSPELLQIVKEFATSSVRISLVPKGEDPLDVAIGELQSGNTQRAWQMARSHLRADGGGASLIGGALALQVGETNAAIEAFERLLTNDAVTDPLVGGFVLLSFTDSGVLHFELNSLAGVALLSVSYAKVGRHQDAIDLAATGFEITASEALLALELLNLRDGARWSEMVEVVDQVKPSGNGRFEIAMLKGEALETLGLLGDALLLYDEIGDLDVDLSQGPGTWVTHARQRAAELRRKPGTEGASRSGTAARLDDDPLVFDQAHDLDLRSATLPSGPSPTFSLHEAMLIVTLDLADYVDGAVNVIPSGFDEARVGVGRLLAVLDDQLRGEATGIEGISTASLDALTAVTEARASSSATQESNQLFILEALLNAAVPHPDAVELLPQVLDEERFQPLIESFDEWCPGSVSVNISGLFIAVSNGPQGLLLALVARLCAQGQLHAARTWLAWADAKGATPALYGADMALAFRSGDYDYVVAQTDRSMLVKLAASASHYDGAHGAALKNGASLIELAAIIFRGRALRELGQLDTALIVFDEAISSARRSEEREELLLAAMYMRGRTMLDLGRSSDGVKDLRSIEAIDSDYLDIGSRLASVAQAEPTRRQSIPERVKNEVWRRDQGVCVKCGSREELEFDHIIPWSKGGSDTARNLQLLCAACNRRKAASI